MNYVYAGMWFVCGLILMVKLGKENRVFYAAGGFFLVLGAWWLAIDLTPEVDLFTGVPGWILRGIAVVALLLLVPTFIRHSREENRKFQEEQKAKQPKKEQDGDETK